MRRTYNSAADVRTSDSLEQTRRLYKGITDIAKRLDEQKSRALTITDLFTPSGETLRVKLKDYCVRLISKDPITHVRKTEELLWRKAFYDVVQAAKKLRKGNAWNETEKALLSVHLAVGVGFYHHLILKLQLEHDLDLVGVIDFAFPQDETGSSYARNKLGQSKIQTEDLKQCVMRLIHRGLVCLGDLARYKLELDPNWDPLTAHRYYKMAIAIDPNIGMPHNQLGNIAGNKNYGLDAVYHYIRCVLCAEPFEGAEGNLKRAIVTHSVCADDKCLTRICVSRLFSLLQLWDYDLPNSNRINQECQDLLTSIESCLSDEQEELDTTINITTESSIEVYLQNCKNGQTVHLTDDMVFKIVAICLMSISRLKSRESNEVQGVVAITLAILSQLVQFTIARLQECLIDIPLPNVDQINSDNHLIETEGKKLGVFEENNGGNKNHNSFGDNQFEELNDKKSVDSEKETVNHNGDTQNESRKGREKSKSLLTKLRRRKRRDGSDSDGSDAERGSDGESGSSSDEMNSDVSETADDILSDENGLSDDALSEDVTDDEAVSAQTKTNNADTETPNELNGHSSVVEGKSQNSDTSLNRYIENGNRDGQDEENQSVTDDKLIAKPASPVLGTTANPVKTFDDNNDPANTIIYISQLKKQSLSPNEVLAILMKKDILASIKICFDWLKSNPDIIRICGKSSRTLLKRVTRLLNLIYLEPSDFSKTFSDGNTVLSSEEKIRDSVKTCPLPEDIDLKGLNILEEVHKHHNWKVLHKYRMTKKEEALLRALKLVEFGHFLTTVDDAALKFDPKKKLFEIVDLNNPSPTKDSNKESDSQHPRGELMRHMGKLWLKAEVRALETRLRSRFMSPYLVPDHEALAKHTPALKRLVYAKKFIVVIPSVVVSALDEVKRISGRAREATRWLEGQLRRGSRFLRAQRPHERLALPYIKGPRPKDKEAWLFFQIIECCHYLTQQTKVGLTNDAEAPVVTLLTGCSPEDKQNLTFSPEGLAKSAGVNIEYIESFHTKWKASSKSHG